jgi:iron complex outermembrane receptor protein
MKKIFCSTTPIIFACVLCMSSSYSLAQYQLDKVVVTSTGEAKSISELAESVGVLNREDILNVSPSHPSEILNRSAGVYINNLGGEGHMTAIRQPITTSAVYLFLEDGIPTRPSGFFNHNGLYEVNIPQSERLEVTKGPGSALYGSGAMGGIINSISAKVTNVSSNKIDTELGSHGWQRMLISSSGPINQHSGASIQANLTQNEGFRDEADYTRKSVNSRFNYQISHKLSVNSSLSITQVDQSGVSSVKEDSYKNNPSKNLFHGDVGARDIEAIRASSEFSFSPSNSQLLTMTPFYRSNQSTMMPSWMVTYDPNVRTTNFESFGLLSKWRNSFSKNGQLITGIDIDHTPSRYKENTIARSDLIKQGDTFVSFVAGDLTYDYDATQTSISPYLHVENRPTNKLLLSAGLRYDFFKVNYSDNIITDVDDSHIRPDTQKLNYDHLSPKASIVYNINQYHDMYANYRHAFRAPSVSKLFRSGKNTNTTGLKPVNTDSVEVGVRGMNAQSISYEVALYYMEKSNDIVSVINGDNDRVSLNAGKSVHQGIELGLNGAISDDFSFSSAFSLSQQTYGHFEYLYNCLSCDPKVINQILNFDGNDVGKAPNTLGNLAIRFQPLATHGLMVELEVEHLGEYFTDETNTHKYAGHDLINLRSHYQINPQFQLYGRIQNIADKRYSTYTSNSVGKEDIEYRPGAPLSVFAGIRFAL